MLAKQTIKQPIIVVPGISLCLALLLVTFNLPGDITFSQAWQALWQVESTNDIIFFYHYMPRVVISVLVGAGLGLSGYIMQSVLLNRLASPTTLGVFAGAELSLASTMLFAPNLLMLIGPEWVAFMGGLLATGLIYLLVYRDNMTSIKVILAGMVVNLFFGALALLLKLLNDHKLMSLFIWGTGDLNQNGWDGVLYLLPRLVISVGFLFCLLPAIKTFQLGDAVANSLGVAVNIVRAMALFLSVFIVSSIVSVVGIIGFVGLVAPALASLLGAKTMRQRFFGSIFCGALLLMLSDALIQTYSQFTGYLAPTGAVTALVGAPFMLWLLQRYPLRNTFRQFVTRHQRIEPRILYTILFAVLFFSLILALGYGQSPSGWQWTNNPLLLGMRMTRVIAAMLAGIALAVSGLLIQRVSMNPMTSPEILGISSGAALAMVFAVMIGVSLSRGEQLLFGAMGSLLALFVMMRLTKRSQFAVPQLVLNGIALAAFFDAFMRIALSSGSEQAYSLLSWLAGSTYLVNQHEILPLLLGVGACLSIVTLLLTRLELLSLGDTYASSLGMNPQQNRLMLLILAALLAALATLVIGPLSFVGLLAPHMAKVLGQYKAREQLLTSMLLGGVIMVLADWLGRNILFPWQLPAGLLASLIGGCYFLFLLRRH